MATLPIQAPHAAQIQFPVFARAVSAFNTVMAVFAEAHALARVAHRRYPFAEW